jgi:hypothetical protein
MRGCGEPPSGCSQSQRLRQSVRGGARCPSKQDSARRQGDSLVHAKREGAAGCARESPTATSVRCLVTARPSDKPTYLSIMTITTLHNGRLVPFDASRYAGVSMGAGNSSESGKSGWDFAVPLLSAAATGIGAVGFVTFFGGAVVWTRPDALGLPAFESVGLLPTSVLITTGAHFLVAAVFTAVLAVAVLYLYSIVGDAPMKRAHADHAKQRQLETEGARSALQLAEKDVADATSALSDAVANKERADALAGQQYDNARQTANAEVDQAQQRITAAKQRQESGEEKVRELADKESQATRQEATDLRRRRGLTLLISGLIASAARAGSNGFCQHQRVCIPLSDRVQPDYIRS